MTFMSFIRLDNLKMSNLKYHVGSTMEIVPICAYLGKLKWCFYGNNVLNNIYFIRTSGPTCACPHLLNLSPKDNRTCVDDGSFFLFASDGIIQSLNKTLPPVVTSGFVFDLQVDYERKLVYWLSKQEDKLKIQKANLSGQAITTVLDRILVGNYKISK